MLRVDPPAVSRRDALFGLVCAGAALMWTGAAEADRTDTHVFLLRGWFGVFSTGLDTLAEELRAKGIKAETADHLAWRSVLAKVIKERAAGNSGALVLIGHSQGGNNVIDIARFLEREKIAVDLLVTLAPYGQDPVPGNVARAINYYHSPGWGAALTTDAGYRGKLSNINLGGDLGFSHVAIDKSPKIQAEIERAILALPQLR